MEHKGLTRERFGDGRIGCLIFRQDSVTSIEKDTPPAFVHILGKFLGN